MTEPNRNYIEISLDDLYDLNSLLKAYSFKRGAQAGWAMRNRSRDKVVETIKSIEHLDWAWPNCLLFEWHEKNRRKDPDNVSSAGRKAILDGMQKVLLNDDQAFLPNDNNRHIKGFIDKFVFDGGNFVRVYQIGETFVDDLTEKILSSRQETTRKETDLNG